MFSGIHLSTSWNISFRIASSLRSAAQGDFQDLVPSQTGYENGRSSSILLHAHLEDQYPSRPHLGCLSLEGGVREGNRRRTVSPPTSGAMRIDLRSGIIERPVRSPSATTTSFCLFWKLTFQHMERMLVTVACSSSLRACFRSFRSRKLVSVRQDVLYVVRHIRIILYLFNLPYIFESTHIVTVTFKRDTYKR